MSSFPAARETLLRYFCANDRESQAQAQEPAMSSPPRSGPGIESEAVAALVFYSLWLFQIGFQFQGHACLDRTPHL